VTARDVLDGIKARLAELQEDRAKAAMWRTTDVARLTAAVDAALEAAETLETYAKNTRYNNHNVRPEWEARADAYDTAANIIRAAIEHALRESQ
jgi:hypothetical protein